LKYSFCAIVALIGVQVLASETARADWSIPIAWEAPGDDSTIGTAAEYDVRYSTSPIDESNWNLATQAAGEPTPKTAGSAESFLITGLEPVTTYYIAVKSRDEAYNWSLISNVISKTTSLVTDVDDSLPLPGVFELEQNYPNPFNPSTRIDFSLGSTTRVTISVYNVIGQQVAQILDADLPAGPHSLTWDALNSAGRAVASGVYLYRFEFEDRKTSGKVVILD
jgi:hypothetical protein